MSAEKSEPVENLSIKLASAAAIVFALGGAIWWAATVDAKLNTVIESVGRFQSGSLNNETVLRQLSNRMELIDKTGTEANKENRAMIRDHEKRLVVLEQKQGMIAK